MIENISVPEEMLISIGSETKEFTVLSRHKQPVMFPLILLIVFVANVLFGTRP